MRNAVDSARQFDGITSPSTSDDPQAPTFLPFSGNFILDASFTLPDDSNPLLGRVQGLDITQKADCATLAQQLVFLVEGVDGFAYIKKGTGSRLHGFQTGWYFHYVCDASTRVFPSEVRPQRKSWPTDTDTFIDRNEVRDCEGSIYVSMSTERIYVYYTHRDTHEPSVLRKSGKTEESGQCQTEGITAEIPVDECPTPRSPTLHRKPSSISRSVVSAVESTPIESSPLVDDLVYAEFNLLPKIHPTPVDISGSVHRNFMKLGALRDLVDSWLPEDDFEDEGGDKHTNPFLSLTFKFMIEWFESSMGHPEVQHEIYKVLDLENDTDAEEITPTPGASDIDEGREAGNESLR